ncbi:hypothetical protein Taro_032934 [Colocasia esculenta]|uniref:CCHC-type domain-containing protein n=1 Tax=Colocasia esculenta TaxID=4460 RepID=A0A843VTY4_COLES|nr:hypothetical protein [Colocasia esculenta]
MRQQALSHLERDGCSVAINPENAAYQVVVFSSPVPKSERERYHALDYGPGFHVLTLGLPVQGEPVVGKKRRDYHDEVVELLGLEFVVGQRRLIWSILLGALSNSRGLRGGRRRALETLEEFSTRVRASIQLEGWSQHAWGIAVLEHLFSILPSSSWRSQSIGASLPFFRSGATPASPWDAEYRRRGAGPWYPLEYQTQGWHQPALEVPSLRREGHSCRCFFAEDRDWGKEHGNTVAYWRGRGEQMHESEVVRLLEGWLAEQVVEVERLRAETRSLRGASEGKGELRHGSKLVRTTSQQGPSGSWGDLPGVDGESEIGLDEDEGSPARGKGEGGPGEEDPSPGNRIFRVPKEPGAEEALGAATIGPAGDASKDQVDQCITRRSPILRRPVSGTRRTTIRGVDDNETASPRPAPRERGGGGESGWSLTCSLPLFPNLTDSLKLYFRLLELVETKEPEIYIGISAYAEMVKKAQLLEVATDLTDRIKGRLVKKEPASGSSSKPTNDKKCPFNITGGPNQERKLKIPTTPNTDKTKCEHCDKPGHTAAECWRKAGETEDEPYTQEDGNDLE